MRDYCTVYVGCCVGGCFWQEARQVLQLYFQGDFLWEPSSSKVCCQLPATLGGQLGGMVWSHPLLLVLLGHHPAGAVWACVDSSPCFPAEACWGVDQGGEEAPRERQGVGQGVCVCVCVCVICGVCVCVCVCVCVYVCVCVCGVFVVYVICVICVRVWFMWVCVCGSCGCVYVLI